MKLGVNSRGDQKTPMSVSLISSHVEYLISEQDGDGTGSEKLGRFKEGQTRHSPILKVIVVATWLFGNVMGSLVYNHTLLTNAVTRVISDNIPTLIPSLDRELLLPLQHISAHVTHTDYLSYLKYPYI